MMRLYISGLLCDNASFLDEQITRSSVMWYGKSTKGGWLVKKSDMTILTCNSFTLLYILVDSLSCHHNDRDGSSEQFTTSSGTPFLILVLLQTHSSLTAAGIKSSSS